MVLAAALLLALIVPLGLVLLDGMFQSWAAGELLLKRGRITPRLITRDANTLEFGLRCLFSGLMGLTLLSFAAVAALGLGYRLASHRQVMRTGMYEAPRFVKQAFLVPLVFFLAWAAILVAVPLIFP